jgi:PAS domain S-box-containing protein
MVKKPTYQELEQRIKDLKKQVSARIRSDKQLKLLSNILEKAADGICVCHNIPEEPYVKFTHWNPRMRDMTGYTLEEINRLGWYQSMYPDPELRQKAVERMSRMREGDDIQAEEWLITTKGGEKKTILISTSVLKEEDGKVHVLAIMQDVTGRKRAEEALKLFRELIERSNDAIEVVDPATGRFLDVNEKGCADLGYSREEFLSLRVFDIDAAGDSLLFTILTEELRKTGSMSMERFHIRKDRTTFPVEINLTYVQLDREYIVTVARDITGRKRAEEALKLFRELIERSNDAIEVVDPATGRFLDVNEKGCADLGYSREELLSLKVFDIDPQIDPSLYPEVTMNELRKAGSSRRESLHKRKDGTMFPVEISLSYVQSDRDYLVTVVRDITERKRADEVLRESEGKYRNLIDSLQEGIWLIDKYAYTTFVNPPMADMLGYTVDEMLGKHLFDFMDEKNIEIASKKLESRRMGIKEQHEFKFRRKDGSSVSALLETNTINDKDGNYAGAIAGVLDITDRKRTEESLKLFRALIERSNDAIEVVDPETGRFLDVNEKGCADLGYSREEFLSLTVFDVDPTGDHPSYMVLIEELRKKGSMSRETSHVRKDRTTFPVETNMSYVQLDRGYLVTVVRDITERKRAEEKGEKLQAQLSNAVEMARLGHWEYDVAKDIYTFNDHFYKIFRTTAEDVGGYTLSSAEYARIFVHPDDRHLIAEEAQKDIETTDPNFKRQLEHRIIYSDGTVGHISVQFFVVKDAQGKTVKTYGVNQDITERKKMEEELLRAQKLESVGILAGGIAHDFNNILTAIIGNISLAKNQITPEDEIFDLLNEVEIASTRAQGLTKQLLTFSKGGTPVKETTSIKDIIKESTLFAMRGSKSICEFSISEDLWPVEVDVGQFNQVINNIMINASQAMPLGGTIKVTIENLIIGDRDNLPIKPGRYIYISIADQGIGIAEDYLSKIFDPYFTTKQEGSGLGLATTYSIIKRHDGHIIVESQLGVGTTIHIYLPASEKAIPEKEETRVIKGQGRILVMDDEASLRRTVGRMLEKLGYEPELAKDGAEAIKMVKEAKEAGKSYDSVILDLTVPGGMGGKECITKLLEIDPGIKAIVSSGYSEDPVLANFQEYGFKGMMPKPFATLSLSKVLHDVLNGEKG